MSEPVILRRCAACGGSYRSGAQFCPQCGSAVSISNPSERNNNAVVANRGKKRPRKNREGQHDATPTGKLDRSGDTRIMMADSFVEEPPSAGVPSTPPSGPVVAPTMPLVTPPLPSSPPADTPPQSRIETAASSLVERPSLSSPPAVADKKPVAPTQKLRNVPGIVLHDAPYDPSARFVLVAAVLFILFLVLLIMSHLVR